MVNNKGIHTGQDALLLFLLLLLVVVVVVCVVVVVFDAFIHNVYIHNATHAPQLLATSH